MQPETSGSAAQGLPRSTKVLLALLGAAVVIGAVVRIERGIGAAHLTRDLTGDGVAAAMLETRLAKTPAGQRLSVLVSAASVGSPPMRLAAVDALGDRHDPAAADAIERAFRDSASQVREHAVDVLPRVDHERGLRLTLAALNDRDNWIREAAIAQITANAHSPHTFVDRRVVPSLVKALEDPDPAVPGIALGTLKVLTGKPWHVSILAPADQRRVVVARWEDWWRHVRAKWPIPSGYDSVPPIDPIRADPAPAVHLADLDGHSINLTDPRGKVRLINFWAPSARVCLYDILGLQQIDRFYRADGVEVIGISPDSESADNVRQWCRAHGVGYRQALAPADVQAAFGAGDDVPVSVLVDARGRVRYMWEGSRQFGTFQAAVVRLLNERPGGVQAPSAAALPSAVHVTHPNAH